jgi:thymidylate kinase
MGIIVGLSGVDGSGKTTVAKIVLDRLQSLGHRVTYQHELDFLLLKPIFNLFTKPLGSKRAKIVKETVIVNQQQGNPVISDLYYFFVWLDNLIAYAYYKMKKGIVIHDRWLFDLSISFDYKNYHNVLIKKLYRVFVRPDIFILLTVPAEVAIIRKKDDPGHIHHDIQYYSVIASRILENARKWHSDAIINANQEVEAVADDVLTLIASFISKRHRVQRKGMSW